MKTNQPLPICSCYSAQEHSALEAFRTTTGSTLASAGPAAPAAGLPLDISIEAVVALLMTCLGLVLGTPAMRPIQWRVWAGKIEREGAEGFMDAEGEVEKDYIGNPFRTLETRPGFMDIRKQRSDFADWVQHGSIRGGD